jgi:transcriptional regulator with XRE-family HTH domain
MRGRMNGLMVDIPELVDRLERKRRKLRLHKYEVAQLLGVSDATYVLWCKGTGMSADALLRVCLWLDVDLRHFISREVRGMAIVANADGVV